MSILPFSGPYPPRVPYACAVSDAGMKLYAALGLPDGAPIQVCVFGRDCVVRGSRSPASSQGSLGKGSGSDAEKFV